MVFSKLSPRGLSCVFGATMLLFLPGLAGAVSYVGLGGGMSPHINTTVVSNYATGLDTVKFRGGYGFEAQFGWEAAPWIDIEGALRYHLSGKTDTLRADREIVSGLDIIGAEGGIRLHPRRGWSNSGPYLRGGIGSFSTTLSLDRGAASQNGEPALGYYAGIGYVREISGSWGVDLRATYIRFNAFDMNADGRKFRAGFLAVTASLVVF
ncbi:MAG: hypothetical protein BWY06_02154 [Candidatus Latescibacteria bacterium ADurb.Bin168]|nr:MAG: hypothetical protein BWY06_02154 [Candidatus Latescibacteria bacterium ADurb.Bin168]